MIIETRARQTRQKVIFLVIERGVDKETKGLRKTVRGYGLRLLIY